MCSWQPSRGECSQYMIGMSGLDTDQIQFEITPGKKVQYQLTLIHLMEKHR